MNPNLIKEIAGLLAQAKLLSRTNPDIAEAKIVSLLDRIKTDWPLGDNVVENDIRFTIREEAAEQLKHIRLMRYQMSAPPAPPRPTPVPPSSGPSSNVLPFPRRPRKP